MTNNNDPQSTAHLDFSLEHLEEEFATTPAAPPNREDVPDGKYWVNVDKVELVNAKRSGSPMLRWTLRIIAPTYVGCLLWRNNMIVSRENLRWLKQDLYVCGLELVRLSDLQANLVRLLDVKLQVTKRTKLDNVNVYLNRRLALDEQGTEATDGRGHHDDVPF